MTAPAAAFDLQGHRGARGLLAENTLESFARALDIGVTTLETDLAITRDDHVVLSHDPTLNPDITRDAGGHWLAARGPAIRMLTLQEVKRFDVGRINPASKYASQFPEQGAVDGARIPTLGELFALVATSGLAARFNLEIKCSPEYPDETLDPETFARLVVETVRRAGLQSRVTIQSFDWRAVLAARRLAPEIATSGLTVETAAMNNVAAVEGSPSPWLGGIDPARYGGSVPRSVLAAGCGTWSPYWRSLDAALVAQSHALGLKVVPWTVNSPEDIAAVIGMGVDGLITDYPDRAIKVLANQGRTLR